MPRFQIIVGPKEVQLALSYLMLIKGYSDEDAFQFLRSLFEGSFEQDDEVFYYFFANAKGTAIFDLKKAIINCLDKVFRLYNRDKQQEI